MADYSAHTLTSVRAALAPGDPQSLRRAGAAFAGVQRGLDAAVTDLSAVTAAVFGGDRPAWAGPAATACRAVVDSLLRFIRDTTPLFDPYDPLLRQAATDLETARTELAGITVDPALPADPAADALARTILATLADSYDQVSGRLGVIPANPNELRDLSEPGSERPTSAIEARLGAPLGSVPTTLASYLPPTVPLPPTSPGPAALPPPTSPGPGAPVALTSAGPVGAPLPGAFAPVVGAPAGALPTSVTPAGGPGGAFTSFGNPATHLATTTRIAGIGAEPVGVQPGRPAPVGAPPGTHLLGRGAGTGMGEHDPQARERTRSTELVGDEDWSDHAGLRGAIGRPRETDS